MYNAEYNFVACKQFRTEQVKGVLRPILIQEWGGCSHTPTTSKVFENSTQF